MWCVPGVLCAIVCDCVPIGVCTCVYICGYSVVLSVCLCMCVCVCVCVCLYLRAICVCVRGKLLHEQTLRVIPAPHLTFPARVSGALRPAEAAELTSLFCNRFLIMVVYL